MNGKRRDASAGRWLWLLALAITTQVFAAPPPVAEWRMDALFWSGGVGEVEDVSGNGHHGTPMGGVGTTIGKVCRAGDFKGDANGHDDYIDAGSSGFDQTGEITVSAWIYARSAPASEGRTVVSRYRWRPSANGPKTGWNLGAVWTGNSFEFVVYDGAGGSGVAASNDFFLNYLNQWVHVVGVFKPSTYVRLYVNGVLAAEDTTSVPASIGYTSGDSLTIGRRSAQAQSYFDGLIDEVRVYDQALDATTIQQIMVETHPCGSSCSITGDFRLFFDDFNDGDYAGWTLHRFRKKGCGWQVQGGRLLEKRNSCHGFLGHRLASADASRQSYVIKAYVDARPTGYNNGAGLVFGYLDDANYYLVRWLDYGSAYSQGSNYRNFELIRVSGGQTTVLDRKLHVTLPDQFELAVDVTQGGGIDVFVDCDTDQFHLQAAGESPPIEIFGPYTNDNDTGVYYDDIEVYGKLTSLPGPSAEWRFDETAWTGAAGEAQDSSGNGHHATPQGGVDTTPGKVCRAGDFKGDAAGKDDFVDAGNGGFDYTGELTVSAWIYPRAKPAGEGRMVVNRYSKKKGKKGTFGWKLGGEWKKDGFQFEVSDGNGTVASVKDKKFFKQHLNTWTHVVGVFKPGSYLRLYVDGVIAAEATNKKKKKKKKKKGKIPTSIGYRSQDPLVIGRRSAKNQSYFDGLIDEVILYDQALDSGQVRSLMERTHPCQVAAPDHFTVSHDGAGIFCITETVLVAAIDNNGDIFTDYTGTITLDTQNGNGNWIATTGDGVLNDAVANDGQATYTFVASDQGIAAFTLSYPDGPRTFNIDVYDGAIRDDDSEDDYLFSPNGFLMTANPVSNPPPAVINDPIPTQIAGSEFQVYLTAYGQTPTHPQCGVIEDYTGDKRLRIWGQYRNPTSGTRTPVVNGVSIPMGNSSQEQHLTFTDGKAVFTAKYKDAGRIRLRVYDVTTPDVISGVTNDFVVKPHHFRFDAVQRSSDGFANPAAVDASGPRFASAGEGFTVSVSPVDVDGDTTPNYGNESPAEGIAITHTLVAPSGGQAGVLSGSLSPQGNGLFTGTFNWSEVGIIRLDAKVTDGNYLGGGDIDGMLSHVGRFTPARFALSNLQGGTLQHACATAGFTYAGEPFGFAAGQHPQVTISARNSTGGVTQNYDGAFAKLTAAGVTRPAVTQDLSNNGAQGTPLLLDHLPDTAGDQLSGANGIFTFTFGTDSLAYRRDANAETAPVDTDIGFPISRVDDGEVGTDFTSGNLLKPAPTNLRFGRISLVNAAGSELNDLAVPMQVEYFNGAGFVPHTADNCTSGITLGLSDLDVSDNLQLSESCIYATAAEAGGNACATLPGALRFTQPPAGGSFNLHLQAPGNTGGVANTGVLGVTATVPGWLQYHWQGVGMSNPTARATFGIYNRSGPIIYLREMR